jgi:hypothetical protein
LTCFVSSSGGAYAADVLYGEELTNPAWHHDSSDTLDSTLKPSEQGLCKDLWQTVQEAESADAGFVTVDTLNGEMANVFPACPSG